MKLLVRYKLFWKVLVSSVVLTACQSEYERRVAQELASGARQDSLFLGISFGMTPKDFYAHCWELNKQGLIREGSGNATVQYKVPNLPYPATMDFYPDFYENEICKMPVTYTYTAWAPWNRHLFADSLQRDVLALYQQQYGDDFITVEHPDHGIAYVRVDGNRQISIFQSGEADVKVVFTDLIAERTQQNEPDEKITAK